MPGLSGLGLGDGARRGACLEAIRQRGLHLTRYLGKLPMTLCRPHLMPDQCNRMFCLLLPRPLLGGKPSIVSDPPSSPGCARRF